MRQPDEPAPRAPGAAASSPANSGEEHIRDETMTLQGGSIHMLRAGPDEGPEIKFEIETTDQVK